MNVLPYFKPETRSQNYADAVIRQIQQAASGNAVNAIPGATAAAEVASGYIQRAFMAAEVLNGPANLTVGLLGFMGRTMARCGEIVLYRDGDRLLPAHTVTVNGGPNPDEWIYEVTLNGPSKTKTIKNVQANRVIHCRWSEDPVHPWRGVGPLQSAELDAQLLAELTKHLEDEAKMPRGAFLPMPKTGGQDDSVDLLKGDVKNAHGTILLVESMVGAWQDGSRGTNSDWGVKRFGANFPDSMVRLYEKCFYMVLSAFGINPQLIMQGSDTREAWRVMLFSLIRPVANGIEAELSAKFGMPVKLQFADLRASDMQGRARAYKSLIDAGMERSQAERICAFEV